ncbi:M15 family metallopeptidase [Fibrella forsythiae]|uniref:M15 family metallopeptidase n=1 Tax=Fibrella forsythiae TaxID=2817061 RepID=A0ABS3JJ68_9BACT|nr:M15 family metallopeptidase [Fibrella forsythiae]MBO0949468.1 M15 family metallopeptidase [Fibrella forsythiae]
MRVLRETLQGADVKQWQLFLRGQGFQPGVADGKFGPLTHRATIAFQTREKLTADGIVGNATLAKAMLLGFSILSDTDPAQSGPNWPPRPNFPSLTASARRTLFGAFQFKSDPKPGNPEHIRILGNWQQQNIVDVQIPQLVGVSGAPANGTIPFNRLAVPQLVAMWTAWEDAGLLPLVLSYAGSFEPRFQRGTTVLSNHAFGAAFDINAPQNAMGTTPALVGERGCVRELVPIANAHGFFWGGHFKTRLDGMHFELAKLL